MRLYALLFGLSLSVSASAATGFVSVRGTGFELNGKPYRFVGANYWQGMNLGSAGPGGDRARLVRELDQMKARGITNLRILGHSQGPSGSPWRIEPASQPGAATFDANLQQGLDFLLAEMGARDMRAVIVLTNFWHWSGGMAAHLNWAGAGAIPYPPPAAGGSWDAFQLFVQQFYTNKKALLSYQLAVTDLLRRTNSVTGVRYADDPTIMAWQLANEPRGMKETRAFNAWIRDSSALIRSLAPKQLITTGVEGETPFPSYAGMDLLLNHSYPTIDYATAHIWVQNWGWYDPTKPAVTYAGAVSRMKAYLSDHVALAAKLGKPLVLEEFGIARDQGSFDPTSGTTARDQYFRDVFDAVVQSASSGSPLQGVNFWAYAGEGRPFSPSGGDEWRAGHPFTGDPPHEPQGWYSVYATDSGTLKIVEEYARKMASAP